MKTCQILFALVPALLVFQVRSQDLVEIKAQSSQLFVPFGETVWVNCTTSAPEKTVYESRLTKLNTQKGPNWVATEVIVDDWENSTLYCLYIGDVKLVPSSPSPTTVLAYALPSNVTIELESELEEGKNYTINCTVHEVAPLEYLTINVFRGEEVIDSQSYDGPHVMDKKTVSHVYTLAASRRDNREYFTCEAVLQLGSETKSVKSPQIKVQTYALPEGPVISAQKWIEKGTSVTVECLIAKAFPPENVDLKMFLEDNILDVIISQTSDGSINGTAVLNTTNSSLGLKTIRCESNLFTLTEVATVEVNIYEHPTLTFNLSSNIVDLGQEVIASCVITNVHPSMAYGLSIIVDSKDELSVENSMVNHPITANRRTPSLSINCKGNIISSPISELSTQTLEVHYPPEFTEPLCPSTALLVEGGKPLSCQADGNPKPTVNCHNGTHNISELDMVTRDMSGLYDCKATNEKGDRLKVVNVTVQYAPSSPTVTVSTNATIEIGNPVNITCESDGLPTPTYRWQIPNNAEVTYSPDRSSVIIHTAAKTHNGTYTCIAKNKHGQMSSKQEVTIKPVEVNIALIVIVVVAIVALVAIAAIISHTLWKKGRKGMYELLNRKANQHNIPTDPSNNKTLSNVKMDDMICHTEATAAGEDHV